MRYVPVTGTRRFEAKTLSFRGQQRLELAINSSRPSVMPMAIAAARASGWGQSEGRSADIAAVDLHYFKGRVFALHPTDTVWLCVLSQREPITLIQRNQVSAEIVIC